MSRSKKRRKNSSIKIVRSFFDEDFISSSCTSKNSYSSVWEAHVVALETKEKYGKELHCYHCDICGGWHLTEHYGQNCEF